MRNRVVTNRYRISLWRRVVETLQAVELKNGLLWLLMLAGLLLVGVMEGQDNDNAANIQCPAGFEQVVAGVDGAK